MKLNKVKLLKTLKQKEDGVVDAIMDLRDFLDSTEDETLSSLGEELYDAVIDILNEADNYNIHEIRNVIECEFE